MLILRGRKKEEYNLLPLTLPRTKLLKYLVEWLSSKERPLANNTVH
jgi:hypothetical protein